MELFGVAWMFPVLDRPSAPRCMVSCASRPGGVPLVPEDDALEGWSG